MTEPNPSREALLRIRGLKTLFRTGKRSAPAVDGIDLHVGRGEALGIVGESGSGKTVTALSVLRLVPDPPGWIDEGEISFKGRDLLKLAPSEMRRIRGNEISMVFQEPGTALNPVFTVGNQIAEAVVLHEKTGKREARLRAEEILSRMGIPDPHKMSRSYPHQMSGGMIQRAVIAMALVCGPDLLLADEPTSALDVTVQAQILDLLGRLRAESAMSLMLISHDFGVVAGVCDRVAVMYAARIVEEADTSDLFENPRHPYTAGLLSSLPSPEGGVNRLDVIPGAIPSPYDRPAGCPFHPRCSSSRDRCRDEEPVLREIDPRRRVACHFPLGLL